MQEVQREWLRRVEAEYASAAITHHLTLWLLQITAPFELVRLGLSIVEDELAHAELSQAVYVAAGGSAPARLQRERLGLQLGTNEALELAIARVNLEVFCLGETVAVRLFSRLRQGCAEPIAQQAFDRILKDEVKHRDFGWTLLEWLFSTEHAEPIAALAHAELARMFGRLRKNYGFDRPSAGLVPDALARGWGLMAAAEYADALRECLERDYVPRFAEYGIDARAAWDAAAWDAAAWDAAAWNAAVRS
jgi:hypothetical protein